MKKFATLAMLMSVLCFTVGCQAPADNGGGDETIISPEPDVGSQDPNSTPETEPVAESQPDEG